MSAQSHAPKITKRSAFSCEPCRKRKVKCGGEQPMCRRCVVREEQCVYKLSPPLSYVQKLENRVKELEEALHENGMVGSASESGEPATTSSPQMKVSAEDSLPADLTGTFEGLKLDDSGSITYHGATSFFQLPTDSSQAVSPSDEGGRDSASPQQEGLERRERLVKNAWQQRALETLSETPEPFQYLLNIHWCWIQPLFNFIYRPAFTRDMEALGPYYSHMLMNAMLSHSVRWGKADEQTRRLLEPYEDGALFGRQARTLLFEDLTRGRSTIPTVQTLLLLSAQECSHGNRMQAWLYSGMAFRVVEDMGIFIDGQKYAGSVQLSDEDIEIRHRLFWSCYFWDKMISLYLGRLPTIQHSTVSPPQIIHDDSAENEIWTPHGFVYPEGMGYPPTQAHSTSCFMQMCRLSVIFNEILIHIYDPLQQNTDAEKQACLDHEGKALRLWWEELPDFLRIDANNLPSHCPPNHIVTLNCLYHTFKILLHRPMLSRRSYVEGSVRRPSPTHLLECFGSATSIVSIFDLFRRSFGYDHCVMSLSYSVYTAASIFLLQVQAGASCDDQTLRRLDFCIQALERVKGANPVIGSSLNLITQELAKLGIDLPSIQSHSGTGSQITHGHQNAYHSDGPSFEISDTLPFDSVMPLPALEGFNPDGLEITPEMFEAFSSLEPISATFDALRDFH